MQACDTKLLELSSQRLVEGRRELEPKISNTVARVSTPAEATGSPARVEPLAPATKIKEFASSSAADSHPAAVALDYVSLSHDLCALPFLSLCIDRAADSNDTASAIIYRTIR